MWFRSRMSSFIILERDTHILAEGEEGEVVDTILNIHYLYNDGKINNFLKLLKREGCKIQKKKCDICHTLV